MEVCVGEIALNDPSPRRKDSIDVNDKRDIGGRVLEVRNRCTADGEVVGRKGSKSVHIQLTCIRVEKLRVIHVLFG